MLRYYFIGIVFVLIFTPLNVAYSQQQPEKLSIPFDAANVDLKKARTFQFDVDHKDPWLLNIENNLLYNESNPDAKIVMRFYGEAKGDHFLEIIMSSPSKRYFAVSFNNEDGYFRLYGENNSWDPTRQPIRISVSDGRLSVYNGVRTVTDELNLRSEFYFLNSVVVFGKDSEEQRDNALGGQVDLDVVSSVRPHSSTLYFLPYLLLPAVGGTIAFLVKTKKREKSENITCSLLGDLTFPAVLLLAADHQNHSL